ncbi:MAG: NAD-dependent deacylase [Candidatus Hydrogenedentota bacterium]
MQEKFQKIKEKFIEAKVVVVLTGAGISAESGVPTFRDAMSGLWEKFNPQELATPQAFRRNPELVWKWYKYRRDLIQKVKPNPGHYAIATLEKLSKDFLLVTQNVDGLHKEAGNKKLVEIHGNITRYRCFNNCIFMDNPKSELPIRCEKCGDWIRPDVVWFGENLPEDALDKSFKYINNCNIFFSIGTSGVVQPAASFPLMAKEKGAFLVEINLEPTLISAYTDISIYGKSGVILSELIKQL